MGLRPYRGIVATGMTYGEWIEWMKEEDQRMSEKRCKNWPNGATDHACDSCDPERIAEANRKYGATERVVGIGIGFAEAMSRNLAALTKRVYALEQATTNGHGNAREAQERARAYEDQVARLGLHSLFPKERTFTRSEVLTVLKAERATIPAGGGEDRFSRHLLSVFKEME